MPERPRPRERRRRPRPVFLPAHAGEALVAPTATERYDAPPRSAEAAILTEFLIILALVVANGVFSGAEIAIISLRKTRLRELVESGSGSAQAVEALRANPERFLATVQVGITVIGSTAAAFGGATIAERLIPVLQAVPLLAPYATELAVGLVVAAVSYLSLVLGELVPKSLALRTSERYALLIGRPLLGLSWVARPLVWLMTASSNLVLRAFGDRTSFTETRLSPEELEQLIEEAATTGSIHPRAGEIATRALEFGGLVVSEVMVPRGDVVALARRASADEIRRVLLEEGHSRMPVYEGSLDNVVGYVSIKDIVGLAWEPGLIIVEDLLRPAWFVPETMKVVDLLQELQRRRLHLAIVVDESGGLAGIVTMEDLVEELVGEIFSEHSKVAPEAMRREPDGSVWALGTATIRDLNRAFGLELPESDDWTTIAGLCVSVAGQIPPKGARVVVPGGYAIEVLDASPRRVRAVRVRAEAP